MTEQSPRRPARYHEDQFVFAPNGRRLSELSDEELLAYDPSRAPRPDPLPGARPAEPDT